MSDVEQLAAAVVEHLDRAHRLLFVTGAGLSAESGLPTYRGIGGLYEHDDDEHGMPVEVALSGQVFRMNPAISWKHIAKLESTLRSAQPNRGHEIIAELERVFAGVTVLTQNVDGFHLAAGSTDVIDIHGDCHDMLCTGCDHSFRVDDYAGFTFPPRCGRCEAVLRPDVVLFGELLPPDKVARLESALVRGFDAVFSIGTTSVFPYIAAPVISAARRHIPTIEINPGRTDVTRFVQYHFECGATEALTAIQSALRQRAMV